MSVTYYCSEPDWDGVAVIESNLDDYHESGMWDDAEIYEDGTARVLAYDLISKTDDDGVWWFRKANHCWVDVEVTGVLSLVLWNGEETRHISHEIRKEAA